VTDRTEHLGPPGIPDQQESLALHPPPEAEPPLAGAQQAEPRQAEAEPPQDEPGGAETTTPAPRAGSRRQRRFAIPTPEGHRVEEKLEAFLEGPAARPPVRHSRHARAGSAPPIPPRPRTERLDHPLKLDSRADWLAAFRLEGARHERYGRPAAVALIEAEIRDRSDTEPPRTTVDALAGSLGQLLRASTRETDRIARMAPTRFNVLLTETNRAEARRFAERVRLAAEAELGLGFDSLVLRIAIAAAGPHASLSEALATAEAELGHQVRIIPGVGLDPRRRAVPAGPASN
jgi:GGDEF domain-containing protein